jgi:hypothetical protein
VCVADEEGFLDAIADAHRVAIAARDVSLEPVGVGGAGPAPAMSAPSTTESAPGGSM